MFINTSILKISAAVLVVASAYFLGVSHQRARDEIAMLELQNTIQQQSLQAEEKIRAATQEMLSQVTEVEKNEQAGIDKVHEHFTALMLHLNRLPSDAADSKGSVQVSDHAAPAEPSQTCECKCTHADQKRVRQLRAKLYTVGRDCDVLAEKYNSLLKFVEIQNGNRAKAEAQAQTDTERQIP